MNIPKNFILQVNDIIKKLEINKIFDTKISIHYNSGTYIEIKQSNDELRFHIFISMPMVYEFSQLDINLDKIIFLLCAHELGHANIAIKELIREKSNDYEYINLNHKILNIAEDYEINWRIFMDRKIGIHADKDGFKPFMNWKYYYDILIDKFSNDIKINLCNSVSNSTMDSREKEKLRNEISKLSNKEIEELSNKLDKIITTMNGGGCEKDYKDNNNKEKIEEDKINIPKNMNTMVDIIKKNSYNISMKENSEELSYYCFDNRRSHNGLIMPGLKQINGYSNFNIDISPIVFIDVSISMRSIRKIIGNIIKIIHGNKIKIVLYDTKIVRIIKEKESYSNIACFEGGTDFENSYNQYLEINKKKMENIFIITDGYDNCLTNNARERSNIKPGYFFDEYPKTKVFLINDDLTIDLLTKDCLKENI